MRPDGSHMHVHNNQAAEREVSQPVRVNQRSRGMKKRRVGLHMRPAGSNIPCAKQPGGGAWSQSAGASKQASERQEEEEGSPWHVRTDGSHMHVHNNQAAERGVSQPVRASKQASERQEEEEGKPARAA